MNVSTKRHYVRQIIEFIKLQLAGLVLFWTAYLGYFVFDMFTELPQLVALAAANLIGYAIFFAIDKEWVFVKDKSRRKTSVELARFFVFMVANYLLSVGIVQALSVYLDITPYIGQFISAALSTLWSYAGLKYWVFRAPRRRAV